MNRVSGAIVPALAVAAGIVLSRSLSMLWWAAVVPLSVAVCVYVFLLHKSHDPVAAFRLGRLHRIWPWMLFLGIGMATESFHRPSGLDRMRGENLRYVTAEIKNVQSKTYGDRIELEIDGTNGARCMIRTGATAFGKGDVLLLPVDRLKEIGKDTSRYAVKTAPMMLAKGILYEGFVNEKQLKKTDHRSSPEVWSSSLRERIETAVEKSHLEKPTAAFLNAVLTGDKDGLDDTVRMTFANGGMAHMLALSGMHMGILAGLVMWLMWPLGAMGKYKWGYAAAIVLLWAYVAVTGMSPSSVRACLMISMAFTGVVMERRNSALHSLSVACLVMMVFDPSVLFDAGFQLSVTCVASLVVIARRLNPVGHRRHPVLFRVTEALLATMTATAASWALVSYYFGQIPVMFLPTNLLLLPLLPAYIAVGAIFILFLCCGWEPGILVWILDKGYGFLVWATDFLSGGDSAVIEWRIPLWGLVGWMAVLGGICWILTINKNSYEG